MVYKRTSCSKWTHSNVEGGEGCRSPKVDIKTCVYEALTGNKISKASQDQDTTIEDHQDLRC